MNKRKLITPILFFLSFYIFPVSPVLKGYAYNYNKTPLSSGWIMLEDIDGEVRNAVEISKSNGYWEFAVLNDGAYKLFIHNGKWEDKIINGTIVERSPIISFTVENGIPSIKGIQNLYLIREELFKDPLLKESWTKNKKLDSPNLALGKPVFVSPISSNTSPENLVDGSLFSYASTNSKVVCTPVKPNTYIIDLEKEVSGNFVIKVDIPTYSNYPCKVFNRNKS